MSSSPEEYYEPEENRATFHRMIMPILSFMQTMLSVLPKNKILLKQIATFCAVHKNIVQFLLRISLPTLSGLKEISTLVSILSSLISEPNLIFDEILQESAIDITKQVR